MITLPLLVGAFALVALFMARTKQRRDADGLMTALFLSVFLWGGVECAQKLAGGATLLTTVAIFVLMAASAFFSVLLWRKTKEPVRAEADE